MTIGKVNEEKKAALDLDAILVEEIGQFGKFQVLTIAQCLLTVFFLAWNINDFVFVAGRIETRCVIPECEDPSQTEFAPSWIANAVPTSGGSVDNCQRFGNSSASWLPNNTCPASLFNTSVLQRCEEYLYQNTNTVVYDFNLACKEWERAIIGTIRIFGMMFALALTGYISDRWGRRRALAINSSCAAVLGLARYWAPNYLAYVLILFLESVLGTGTFSCTYVMTIELLGPKFRVMGGAIVNSSFAVGQMVLGLIAWAATDWRSLILALYIPQFITFAYFWTLNESVRWLISKGKFKDTENILKKAAQTNGRVLSQKSLENLQAHTEAEKTPVVKDTNNKPLLAVLVLKDKRLLTRCFVSSMWWVTATFVYYGLSINAVSLTGNMYLNYVIVSVVEIPGYWSVVVLIDRIGRKPTIITFLWLCAAFQIAFIFIPNGYATLSLIAYILSKLSISVVLTSMNIYTLELFPTECRHRLYGFCSMVGRMGAMMAPLTPALAVTLFEALPFVLFGGMALLSGLLTFLMPETLGSKLPDTIGAGTKHGT